MKNESQRRYKYDYKHLRYRVVSWFLYTVLISLIPQGIQVYVKAIIDNYNPDKISSLLEILIVSIIISASTLKDLFEGDLHTQKKLFSFFMLFACLYTIAAPSLMYGIVISRENFKYSSSYNSAYAIANQSALISFFIGLLVRVLSSLKKVTETSSSPPTVNQETSEVTLGEYVQH